MKALKATSVVRAAMPVLKAFREFRGGVELWMVGTEDELIKNGVVAASELPARSRGSCRHLDDVRIGRNADGRCNVRVWGIRAAKLDLGFQGFMKGILADRQLSLVAHEKERPA